jgi:hypothetical protein
VDCAACLYVFVRLHPYPELPFPGFKTPLSEPASKTYTLPPATS